MAVDPMGGTPTSPRVLATDAPQPPTRLAGVLGNPTTITTIAGALIAIAIGVADTWFFHQMSYDQALIWAGLGALLGVNPLQRVA